MRFPTPRAVAMWAMVKLSARFSSLPKGCIMEDQEMTKEEMQRYLNQQAEAGIPEEQALKNLADVLGISYPKLEK